MLEPVWDCGIGYPDGLYGQKQEKPLMGAILLVLVSAVGMGAAGFSVLPMLLWAAVVAVLVGLVRFGYTGAEPNRGRHGRWYRRW